MAVKFHPLPASLFDDKQQWYIQRMNNELRELFALEGTLRNPRGPRRSDASIARRGSVQVHVSRVSDQAIGSTSIDADTLDGLDSTDFLVTVPTVDARNVVKPSGTLRVGIDIQEGNLAVGGVVPTTHGSNWPGIFLNSTDADYPLSLVTDESDTMFIMAGLEVNGAGTDFQFSGSDDAWHIQLGGGSAADGTGLGIHHRAQAGDNSSLDLHALHVAAGSDNAGVFFFGKTGTGFASPPVSASLASFTDFRTEIFGSANGQTGMGGVYTSVFNDSDSSIAFFTEVTHTGGGTSGAKIGRWRNDGTQDQTLDLNGPFSLDDVGAGVALPGSNAEHTGAANATHGHMELAALDGSLRTDDFRVSVANYFSISSGKLRLESDTSTDEIGTAASARRIVYDAADAGDVEIQDDAGTVLATLVDGATGTSPYIRHDGTTELTATWGVGGFAIDEVSTLSGETGSDLNINADDDIVFRTFNLTGAYRFWDSFFLRSIVLTPGTSAGVTAAGGASLQLSGNPLFLEGQAGWVEALDDFRMNDNLQIVLGTGQDATIDYDGTNLVLKPDVVGSGDVFIDGRIQFNDNDGVVFGTGDDVKLSWDGADFRIENLANVRLDVEFGSTSFAQNVRMVFNASGNVGQFRWIQASDYFRFDNGIWTSTGNILSNAGGHGFGDSGTPVNGTAINIGITTGDNAVIGIDEVLNNTNSSSALNVRGYRCQVSHRSTVDNSDSTGVECRVRLHSDVDTDSLPNTRLLGGFFLVNCDGTPDDNTIGEMSGGLFQATFTGGTGNTIANMNAGTFWIDMSSSGTNTVTLGTAVDILRPTTSANDDFTDLFAIRIPDFTDAEHTGLCDVIQISVQDGTFAGPTKGNIRFLGTAYNRGHLQIDDHHIFPGANVLRFQGDTSGSALGSDTDAVLHIGHDLISFFDVTTPIAQPTATAASGYAAVGGTNVNSNDTFTGAVGATAYTIGDIVAALKNLGLINQ